MFGSYFTQCIFVAKYRMWSTIWLYTNLIVQSLPNIKNDYNPLTFAIIAIIIYGYILISETCLIILSIVIDTFKIYFQDTLNVFANPNIISQVSEFITYRNYLRSWYLLIMIQENSMRNLYAKYA